MNNNELKHLQQAACETAVSAGKLVREKWLQPREIQEKGFRDFVTDADIAAQALITGTIQQTFPEHGFLTEEKDDQLPKTGPIIWIIDPVDGTTNYSRQHPIYCISVAAMRPTAQGFEPLAGAIYDPMQGELFHAAKGHGAWLNERRINVSTVSTLTYMILGTDWSYNKRLQRSFRDDMGTLGQTLGGVRSLGSASLGLAWVAAGRYDAYFNYNLRPWDIAAAWLLIEEAGGTVSNRLGELGEWDVNGMDVFGSNGRIHSPFLDLLQQGWPANQQS